MCVFSFHHLDLLFFASFSWLVVWNMFFFPHIGKNHPSDFRIFQRGRYTTNQPVRSAVVLGASGVVFQCMLLAVFSGAPEWVEDQSNFSSCEVNMYFCGFYDIDYDIVS